jgi:hypothetical protein
MMNLRFSLLYSEHRELERLWYQRTKHSAVEFASAGGAGTHATSGPQKLRTLGPSYMVDDDS